MSRKQKKQVRAMNQVFYWLNMPANMIYRAFF
jgi:hypothetical protein